MEHTNGFGALSSYPAVRQRPDMGSIPTYDESPPVNSILTSISFPNSSQALATCTVASMVAMAAQTFWSAKCLPGQTRLCRVLEYPLLEQSEHVSPSKTE